MLEEQDYLPLLDAQRLLTNDNLLLPTDRRVARGRATRLAILEVRQTLKHGRSVGLELDGDGTLRSGFRVTGSELAATLHLHPTTVYAHLKQLQALGIIE